MLVTWLDNETSLLGMVGWDVKRIFAFFIRISRIGISQIKRLESFENINTEDYNPRKEKLYGTCNVLCVYIYD